MIPPCNFPKRMERLESCTYFLSENTKGRPWRKWKENMTIQLSPTRTSYFQSQYYCPISFFKAVILRNVSSAAPVCI
jgi:hypothetical protein